MARESMGEVIQSPEELNHTMEQLLLSCERAGEGGKGVVLKLSVNDASLELQPALDALNIETGTDAQAIKLFKLYLPSKGAWEYTMHQKAYDAVQSIPEAERKDFALVPELSARHEITLENDAKRQIERRFDVSIVGNDTQLIAMEYIDGDDLATIFYKWILEREHLFSAEETDAMNFTRLYEETARCLRFETLPDDVIDDPRALELAEWKNSAQNTGKLYDYLHKYNFPMPRQAVVQVENTIKRFHQSHITHGDAFERNLMITGGMKALRSGKSLEDEQAYVIDFGESKDHFVEGVDEFAVVRRLKKLTQSKEEEDASIQKARFKELDLKMALLFARDKGLNEIYFKTVELSGKDRGKALALAWRRTVGIDQNWTEKFFAIAKRGIKEGLFSWDEVSAFANEKMADVNIVPYQKRVIQECVEWVGQE